MLNYTEYLDDVIYCNDRSYNNMGAWSSNSSALTTYLTYKGSTNDNNNLKCNQITDQFSVSNNQAKLEYPVGLLTKTEVSLLGNNTLRKSVPTGTYWLMTPYSYDAYWGYGRINYVDYQGSITQDKVHNLFCVRPVITLKNNIEFTQGDGSKEDPYVVDLD